MKVLVTGSRNWDCLPQIEQALREHGATSVVHGAAPGADTLAGQAAENLGLEVFEHPALWRRYGRAAGPIRNREMLDSHPDIERVLAFHEDVGLGKGTRNMVTLARQRDLPVSIYLPESVRG